jgi:uncharacterized membrane protein YbhN (UPF0104 family)
MFNLVVFIIVSIVVILLLLFMKTDIVVEYTRRNEDDSLALSIVSFAGLFKYKYKFPMADSGFKIRKLKKKRKDEKVEGWGKVLKWYKSIRDFYISRKFIFKYLKCRIVIKEYKLYLEAGTGDASSTGIITGVIWTLSGIIDSFFSSNFLVKNKRVNIKANFNDKVLTIDLLCIFSVKIVHIIVVALKYLFDKFRKKK